MKIQSRESMGMFDLGKGILILIVILHHTLNDYSSYGSYSFFKNIYIVPMFLFYGFTQYGVIPTFFVINGYNFHPFKTTKKLIKRCRVLINQYVLVGIAVIFLAVIKKLIMRGNIIEPLKVYGIPYLLGMCPGDGIVYGRFMFSIGPIWFILSLLEATIIMFFVMKFKSEITIKISIVIIVSLGYILSQSILLPFCISQAMICTGYIYFGMRIKNKGLLYKKIPLYIYGIMFSYIGVIMVLGEVSISNNIWKLGFFDIIATLIAGFLLLKIYIRFYSIKGVVFSVIRVVGKYSLWILSIHTVEYMIIPWEKISLFFKKDYIWGILIEMAIRSIIIFLVLKCIRYYKKKKNILRFFEEGKWNIKEE